MMFERGDLDEEITVYGQSDHVCFEAAGSWSDGCGAVAGAQREHRDAVPIWTIATGIEKIRNLF